MARHPFDRQLPLRRVERAPAAAVDESGWPGALPAVTQLLRDGLELGPATILVGDNGTGKSTLVEAIAMAYGLNAEGGSTHARHGTRASESPLAGWLRVEREAGASRWGYFLRAETMHGLYTYLESNPARGGHEARFHEMSHGESFLEVLRSRFDGSGFYVLDEPESALSFSGCLALVGVLHDLMATGTAQILMATHSPVIAALPGARILELDDAGWHETAWDDLALVDHHRRFLAGPERYLRYVLE
jgi:predicted ATPase